MECIAKSNSCFVQFAKLLAKMPSSVPRARCLVIAPFCGCVHIVALLVMCAALSRAFLLQARCRSVLCMFWVLPPENRVPPTPPLPTPAALCGAFRNHWHALLELLQVGAHSLLGVHNGLRRSSIGAHMETPKGSKPNTQVSRHV